VLDRRGAAGEATGVIEKALELSGTGTGANPGANPGAGIGAGIGVKTGEVASARYLYNAVRADELASTRAFLDESARSRFQTLAQALNTPQADAQTSTGVAR